MIEVTQEDRDLVADYLEAEGDWTTGYVQKIRSGVWKNDLLDIAHIARQAGVQQGLDMAAGVVTQWAMEMTPEQSAALTAAFTKMGEAFDDLNKAMRK